MICPFQPVVPNDVLAIRSAPGATKRARCPSVKYSAFCVTVSPGPTVTTPVQVSQPPLCGPPAGSGARFQLTTVLPQLRVTPSTRLGAGHFSGSEKTWVGGALAPRGPERTWYPNPCWGQP